MNYIVTVHTDTDNEYTTFETSHAGQAHDYCSYYTPAERNELKLEVFRVKPSGEREQL